MSLFFADKQAHDCCNKGHCSRKNPDTCCQSGAKTAFANEQAKDKFQFVYVAIWTLLPARTTYVHFGLIHSQFRSNLTLAHSPPGEFGNFSLPLLV